MSLPRWHARVGRPGADPRFFEVGALTLDGALLFGGGVIEVGAEVDVEIAHAGPNPVCARGRVARHERLTADRTGVAVRFESIEDAHRLELEQLVRSMSQSLGARVLGRLRTELQREGTKSLPEIADALHSARRTQSEANIYSPELITGGGSDAEAEIISVGTGARRDCIVWSLNLYLGLNRHPAVIERATAALQRFGTGSGTSAPSGGLNTMHAEIASRVAEMVGKPAALIYPTGYSANLGALSSLPGPNDLLLLDRECHASMFDGVRLSGRQYVSFRHNNVDDLKRKLERYGPRHDNLFVVVESAYSMSGDLAPLREIVALKAEHDFFLYVDEAHTFGFYGEHGRGYCYDQGVSDQVDFIMSTFSKATASMGGFVATEERYCTLMQATATSFIFQACLTPPDAATILGALDEIRDTPRHMQRLHDKNRYLRELLLKEGFDLGASQSPVVPVYVKEVDKLYLLCAQLFAEGIYSVPVTYPAVGLNEGRIRFIVNAHHTEDQIRQTVAVLAAYARALGVIEGERTPVS